MRDAYYYSFDETKEPIVDTILSAVGAAGKAYHHTQDWNEPYDNGKSVVDLIQDAANAARDEIMRLRADKLRLDRLESAMRDGDEILLSEILGEYWIWTGVRWRTSGPSLRDAIDHMTGGL